MRLRVVQSHEPHRQGSKTKSGSVGIENSPGILTETKSIFYAQGLDILGHNALSLI